VGIEPTTEGFRGSGNRPGSAGDVVIVRHSQHPLSGGVGLVQWCRFGMDIQSIQMSVTNEAINPLANNVGVSAVPCVLFNHVNDYPPQVELRSVYLSDRHIIQRASGANGA
jgi:hypothetical protein